MIREAMSGLELAGALMGARLGREGPIYLVHALTARCNARCGFCAWNPEFYNPRDQLSTEEIERLYADARGAGFVGVTLWGGEPLLHPDFGRIVAHAKGLGLRTNLITNGFLLERSMDAVLEHVDRLCVSLDHPSSEHDAMRRIPGLFDRVVASVREVRRRAPDRPIIFVCTLQRANVAPETVREMAELLRSLGVVGIFNGLREEAASEEDANLDRFAASPEELRLAFATLADLKRRGYPIVNSHTHLEMMREGPPVYRCHWPKLMLPIEANGDVVDCMHWGTRPIGNLREHPLSELLRSERLRELAGPRGEACHRCVSIHRVEISEVWEGNLEPVRSWCSSGAPPRRARPGRRRPGAGFGCSGEGARTAGHTRTWSCAHDRVPSRSPDLAVSRRRSPLRRLRPLLRRAPCAPRRRRPADRERPRPRAAVHGAGGVDHDRSARLPDPLGDGHERAARGADDDPDGGHRAPLLAR